MVGEFSVNLIRFDVYKNNNDMKQTWKNKWLMLLGGVILLGGLSGCEDRTARLNGSPLKAAKLLLM